MTLRLGCAGFAKKFFSLQSETKRNEIRFACVSHTHVKNFFFSLPFASFRFKFFASDQSETNTAYFCFVSLPKLSFVLFSLFFCFRFASDAKKAKKHFFRIEAKKFHFRFASFCFKAKMIAVFCLRFASFHFKAKMMEVFCFRFASFRFEAKNYGSFLLVFCFVFASFHFRFASDFHVSHQCETSEKISLPFRFISLRSENDGAPAHPT